MLTLDVQNYMRAAVDCMTTVEGLTPSPVPRVQLVKVNKSFERRPMIYDPSIVIVLQGYKMGYTRDEVHRYDADRYLVMSLPVPFECEAAAEDDEPYLALSIDIDIAMLGELASHLSEFAGEAPPSSGIHSAPLTTAIHDAVHRLVRTMESPREALVLGPPIVREIVYRVLCEAEGVGLRAIATGDNRFSKMSRILRRIHADCAKEINVAELAKELHMGLSAFHQSFKAITSTSPIQYVKAVRLHKARYLMAYKGMKASEAAYEVGYMSSSQFNREFKRLFGLTPQQEISRLREQAG